MKSFWAQIGVIAYRDFKAVAYTPVFLLFLLAPLLMLAMGMLGGGGAHRAAEHSTRDARIAVLATPEEAKRFAAADAALRPLTAEGGILPPLEIIPSHGAADPAIARQLLDRPGTRYEAVAFAPAKAPQILSSSESQARYLAALADHVARSEKAGLAINSTASQPKIRLTSDGGKSARARMSMGYAAVFLLFLLTLLLSAQTIGTFAEEKSNKIIEILTAAAPLEAIFVGKLVGMYGVAMLFIGFWGTLVSFGLQGLASLPGFPDISVSIALGLPMFVGLGLIYFTLSFFLLGAVFLGIGAQAPTVRDIQMLSLPVTFFEFGMFALASAAASQPGSRIALIAQIFPFSSPFAMAARGATDPALWPHLVAILWQLLWVAITIRITAALFRRGVLRTGPGLWAALWRRKG